MNFRLPSKFPLLPRKKNSDKFSYGHVLLVAGSSSMSGAALLASLAAAKSGTGLVTLACPDSVRKNLTKSLFEIMKMGLPEASDGSLARGAFHKIITFTKKRKINVCAIGPGLSGAAQTAEVVQHLVKSLTIPIVLDADGINALRGKADFVLKRCSSTVVTPHRKEFERLFGKALPKNIKDRIELAKKLSNIYHVVLVVKGSKTLVVQGNRVYANKTGNPSLAKGGSGDVLTGMIASFIAQGLEPFLASVWAVYFHGKAADIGVKTKSELSLMASDIIDLLPRAFKAKIAG